MPSSVPIVESSLNDRHVVLSGTSRFPVSTAVTDPITYRPAVRLFNRQENPCVSCRQLNEDVSSQYSFQQRSVPRSLPSLLTPNVLDSPFSSHLARCNQLFTPIPISVPDHSPLNLEDTILPGERVAVRGRAHYSSQRYEVSFPDSDVGSPSAGILSATVRNQSLTAREDQVMSYNGFIAHETLREVTARYNAATSSSPSTPSNRFSAHPQCSYDLEWDGERIPMYWGGHEGLGRIPREDYDSELSVPTFQDSINSSPVSAMAPPNSPPYVLIDPVDTSTVNHTIFEDKTLTVGDINELFMPSAPRHSGTSSRIGILSKMWICQWPGCRKSIRRQERMGHALEHNNRKRFNCSCGASFARIQDKTRHLREQKICAHCPRPVGRNGSDGICPTCIETRAGVPC